MYIHNATSTCWIPHTPHFWLNPLHQEQNPYGEFKWSDAEVYPFAMMYLHNACFLVELIQNMGLYKYVNNENTSRRIEYEYANIIIIIRQAIEPQEDPVNIMPQPLVLDQDRDEFNRQRFAQTFVAFAEECVWGKIEHKTYPKTVSRSLIDKYVQMKYRHIRFITAQFLWNFSYKLQGKVVSGTKVRIRGPIGPTIHRFPHPSSYLHPSLISTLAAHSSS